MMFVLQGDSGGGGVEGCPGLLIGERIQVQNTKR